ncbi:MAG: serine protease [Lachnospiraceae bacterium]|nr:serine protease [Lachnospiraceae bacterium]
MNEEKIFPENSEQEIEKEELQSYQPNFVMSDTESSNLEENKNNMEKESAEVTKEDVNPEEPNFILQTASVKESETQQPIQPVTYSNQSNQGYQFWTEKAGDNIYQNQQNTNFENPMGTQTFMAPPKKERKEHKLLKGLVKAAAVGLVAGIGFCAVVFASDKLGIVNHQGTHIGRGSSSSLLATVTSSDNTVKAPSDLTKVVEQCMPSIVSITSTVTSSYNTYFGTYDKDSTGSGSGIVLKISDDEVLIVTNNHVISGAKKIMVGFYGADSEKDMVEATVKGTDSGRDLAVVLVKTKDIPNDIKKNIAEAKLGSSDDAKVGEMSIAIGNSLGYGQSLTVGYISAKDRKVEVEEGNMTLLQTDAAINPGNSGGALLDIHGNLIGINSAKYADTSVEGMGFAIPISDAITVINELMNREVLKDEEKGYLGISGKNITEEVQQQYPNFPIGVYVYEVSEDGAAKDAGIMVGDVIIGINDTEVLTIKELAEKINSYRVGTKLTLKVLRYEKGEYKEHKIKVTLKGVSTLDSLENNQNAQSGQQNQTPNNENQDGNDNNNPDSKGYSTNPYGFDEDEMEQFYRYFYGY